MINKNHSNKVTPKLNYNPYLKNSLIPSSENDPLKIEYFIFLTLSTANAG